MHVYLALLEEYDISVNVAFTSLILYAYNVFTRSHHPDNFRRPSERHELCLIFRQCEAELKKTEKELVEIKKRHSELDKQIRDSQVRIRILEIITAEIHYLSDPYLSKEKKQVCVSSYAQPP